MSLKILLLLLNASEDLRLSDHTLPGKGGTAFDRGVSSHDASVLRACTVLEHLISVMLFMYRCLTLGSGSLIDDLLLLLEPLAVDREALIAWLLMRIHGLVAYLGGGLCVFLLLGDQVLEHFRPAIH